MATPAARTTDIHACPIHGAGVIGPPGAVNILIGGLPATRVTDLCICPGPPNAIATGSLGVILNGLGAARTGDLTLHGGTIAAGQGTVLIGETGNPVATIARSINPSRSTINCGFNVDAAIDRIYRRNVNAVSPPNRDGSFPQIGARHATKIQWGHTLNDAVSVVRAGGTGTTAIVGIDYGNGGSHVVVMTNHYGTPVSVEGQDWGPGQGAEAIVDPGLSAARYSPHNVGIGVLPDRAPGL